MAEPTDNAADAAPPGRRVPASTFAPVRSRKTFEDVVRQIVDLLRSGQLAEGDQLPGERALAAAMEVSRPTLRLAVSQLVECGILRVIPGRAGGISVASMWIPDGLVGGPPELRADEIFQVLEARRTVEPRVAQLAALRGNDEHFRKMQETIELQSSVSDDRRKLVQADVLFHRIMWQAAQNPPLEEVLVAIFARLAFALDMTFRTAVDRVHGIGLHVRTLAAIKRGDPDEIDAAMDEHLGYLEVLCQEALGRRLVREPPAFLRSGSAQGAVVALDRG